MANRDRTQTLSPIDSDLFKKVAASFASGVTAITTGTNGHYHGMTASAFTSLSLNPPLILVCLDLNSTTLSVIKEHTQFAVNILSRDQEWISQALATRGQHDLAGIPVKQGYLGLPVIEGALAHFECTLRGEYIEGDHVILVGAVESGGVAPEQSPLVYFRGKYHSARPG